MELTQAVLQLNAAAEPSRLRLLVALLGGEATVGDLVLALVQSQPRVSRHLRLLAEAGLVESFREGRSIYYRWSAAGFESGIVNSVAALGDSLDPTIAGDRERLQKLFRQRERHALRRALRVGRARGLHSSDADAVSAELIRSLPGARRLDDILHIGCGSGELLRRLLPESRTAVGTETSGPLRQVARARLRQGGLPRWTIRDAPPSVLPFEAEKFDLVIVEDALGAGPDMESQKILSEAARVLRPAGKLLILDRILPTDGALSPRLGALGFTITRRQWLPGRAPDRALFLANRTEADFTRTGTDD
jgi:DNA-binding transcriptional ArsR family regulator